MKPRLLRACISALVTGEYGLISVKPKPTFFNFNGHSYRSISYPITLASCQLQGVESLKRPVYSSSDEVDDFSELGSPVSQGVGTLLKLMTKKPDPLRKTDHDIKASSGMCLHAESIPTSKDISLKQGKNASNCKNSSSITIENIPSVINLSQLKEVVSSFGKILNASMRTVPNELNCCDVEFESVESGRRAVSVGEITLKSFHLPIRPLHVPVTVTIRIRNISPETNDSAIHSLCMSYGPMDGLVRTKDDAVDAFFTVDSSDTPSILKKLNRTIIDDCRWSAHVPLRDSTSEATTSNEDAGCKLRLQIRNGLFEWRREFHMKKMYLEDLENLHHALVHLHPVSISK